MLTTSLALPPPGTGDFIMTQHRDPVTGEYSVTIDQADPVILISAHLLREAFTCSPDSPDFPPAWSGNVLVRLADVIPADDIYLGATLRIDGTNCTVIYRITRRHDEYTYIGEWPD